MKSTSLCIAWLLLTTSCLAQHLVMQGGSIRAAIEKASRGDTIFVHAGTYRESPLVVDKPIALIGMGWPVLDGENKFEILTVHAPHVTITGFTLANSGVSSMKDLAGLGADKAHHLVVRNNRFLNTFFGIKVDASRRCRIENNRFVASPRPQFHTGNGIHLWTCDSVIITGNLIEQHRDGIYLEFVTNTTVTRNTCEDNLRYGMHFMFSHDNVYRKNIFRNNGAGVAVMYTKRVKMFDNTFEQNWGNASYGLLIKDITDSEVSGNRFLTNTVGIFMEGAARCRFETNELIRNGWALQIQANCEDNHFLRNNFYSNTFDVATNGSLVLNTFDLNYWDRYEGYDMDRDRIGDIPFRPVSLFATVVERVPTSMLLWRSFLVFLLDRSERVLPAVTPENLKDEHPMMKPYDFSNRH